jgi:hypothetical protein
MFIDCISLDLQQDCCTKQAIHILYPITAYFKPPGYNTCEQKPLGALIKSYIRKDLYIHPMYPVYICMTYLITVITVSCFSVSISVQLSVLAFRGIDATAGSSTQGSSYRVASSIQGHGEYYSRDTR